jgi:hypothetical protein
VPDAADRAVVTYRYIQAQQHDKTTGSVASPAIRQSGPALNCMPIRVSTDPQRRP